MTLQSLNPRADLLRREQAFAANLTAARGLQDILSSNLGPKGTLKMLVGGAGQIKTTKDGNVLLKEMHIQHPTAAVIARAATAQDITVGDGSTTDILIIGELMKLADHYLSEGVHPRKLTEGLDMAREAALKLVEDFKVEKKWEDRELMLNVARTSLGTKLEAALVHEMSEMLVDAMQCLTRGKASGGAVGSACAEDATRISLDLHMVEVLSMKCGVKNEAKFIRGMVMDHGCRHADMPSRLSNCYTLTCNVSLEYEKTEVNSAFFYSSADQRARLAAAERRYTDAKVMKIIELKRKVCTPENKKSFVIFNQKGIDPPALEMLAREGIMALRRVKRRNMERLTLCCGGNPVNAVEDLHVDDLGFADSCWEISMGDEKYTFVEGVKDPRACCILIKAPTDHAIEQIKDAIRDGLRSLKNLITDGALIPGAGAFEIALSEYLSNYAKTAVEGKARLGVQLLAEAVLCVPKALAKNAGFDQQDKVLELQTEYRKLNPSAGTLEKLTSFKYVGLDLDSGKTCVPDVSGIWDNVCVKKQTVVLTTTLASQLLLVDEIIKAGKQMNSAQGN